MPRSLKKNSFDLQSTLIGRNFGKTIIQMTWLVMIVINKSAAQPSLRFVVNYHYEVYCVCRHCNFFLGYKMVTGIKSTYVCKNLIFALTSVVKSMPIMM